MEIKNNSKNMPETFMTIITQMTDLIYKNQFKKNLVRFIYDYLTIEIRDAEDGLFSGGQGPFTQVGEPSVYLIYINVPPNPEQDKFEYVLGHELGHLLFNNIFALSDFCHTDSTYSSTSVQRHNANIRYGIGLEEAMADYYSNCTRAYMHKKDYNEVRLSLNSRTRRALNILEPFVFALNGRKEGFFYGDYSIDHILGIYDITNPFLHEIFEAHNLSSFIEEYDKWMGAGTWKSLNQYLDDNYKTGNMEAFHLAEKEINSILRIIEEHPEAFEIYKEILRKCN